MKWRLTWVQKCRVYFGGIDNPKGKGCKMALKSQTELDRSLLINKEEKTEVNYVFTQISRGRQRARPKDPVYR